MKKLGILAISSLLFFAVSCKKSNTTPENSSNYTSSAGVTPSKGMSDAMSSVYTATTTDLGSLSFPAGTANKNSKPNVEVGVINGEQINPNTSDDYIVKPIPIRNDMNNPYTNTNRIVKSRVRHDMLDPFNDPR